MASAGGHDPNLAHHFENAEQQMQSAKLGMWLFLATEILFFGGLFCAYTIYRVNHPEIFVFAHQFLDKTMGAINTVVLICSSFTMAWAVRAAQLRQRGILQVLLSLTIICAFGFLGIKYIEYSHKWEHGLLWASKYAPSVHGVESHDQDELDGSTDHDDNHDLDSHEAEPEAHPEPSTEPEPEADAGAATLRRSEVSLILPAPDGPAGLAEVPDEAESGGHEVVGEPANAQTFFSIYFLMTGLHGVHVVGGIFAMFWLLWRARRGDFDTGNYVAVDMIGLYWHLVDLIWIYLFFLLYLIR